jgi:hypothetical protein
MLRASSTATPRVLNPTLYRRLEQLFGRVLVAHEGKPLTLGRPSFDALAGRWRPKVVDPGEWYRAACPYCEDTRHSLYVNHRFGQIESETGACLFWMAKCFSANCLSNPDNRWDLEEKVYAFESRRDRERFTAPRATSPSRPAPSA